MHFLRFILAILLCATATFAHAVGFRFVRVPADADAPMIRAAIWYPCLAPPGEVKLRMITLPATENCAVSGEKLPLIVISHGFGGDFTSHHDLAETLADAGFVVVVINHPVDTGDGDMSRADTLAVLTERPADIKRLIDHMLGIWPDRARLDPDKIGFYGFSRGGYTGLVIAGGHPDIRKAVAFCPEGSAKPSCGQLQRNEIPRQAIVHDPRVKAVVVADPAFGPLFNRVALAGVKLPIQVWASALSGEDRISEIKLDYVAAIDRGLPVKSDYHVVPGAGHFAFALPCARTVTTDPPRWCTDRPGFDRSAFHKEFNAAVLAFFRKYLVKAD
jgi:predicted dienelactone hydrolase